ncbi:MAG: hypothetical protein K2X42_10125 [Burkholderiaceae bacterium]|nr:hypothetical protein [Burkholderiaceae bacterium]MBX9716937.1 hypothetical protein [Burkholderiaceae bacterium]
MSMKAIRVIRAPRVFKSPIRRASDTWDWLTPEEVVRTALAAYYATCRRMERLAWADSNTEGIDRFVFACDLNAGFCRRVKVEGFEKGVCEEWRGARAEVAELNMDAPETSIREGQQ